MIEIFLFSALLALFEMDTTYVGQFLISRASVVGGVFGFLTGNLFFGLQIGIFTELLFADYNPIGGAVPPSGALSAGIAVLTMHFFGVDAYIAFFAGVLSGFIFSFIDKNIRRLKSEIQQKFHAKIINGTFAPKQIIASGLFFQYCCALTFVFVIITLLGPFIVLALASAPQKLLSAFAFSYFMAPWIGLVSLFMSFSPKQEAD
ncbi:MAG: PTS sugar transporter subunit IIC [Elusimicrobiota bacterium]|jgi:mannose/fructose/N-acetylgalactosamine-specific phosphotransferase system component IIC|nr:PTS sugar transporter subunit IIC [Elusimicrobiota bacterium]